MQKRKRKLSKFSTVHVFIGLLLVGIMTLIGTSVFLEINGIVVIGAVIYTPEQVAGASGIERGDSLLYLNKHRIISGIRSELPYVNSVVVTRDLPDSLVIEITESTAVAYIPFQGEALVIDSTGRVLERSNAIQAGRLLEIRGVRLIEIRGVAVADAEVGNTPTLETGLETSFQTMQDILVAMEREGIADDVDYLDVTSIINIDFGYKGIYRVILGGIQGMRHKLSVLQSDIAQIQQRYPNTRGVLNMTDPSGDSKFNPE